MYMCTSSKYPHTVMWHSSQWGRSRSSKNECLVMLCVVHLHSVDAQIIFCVDWKRKVSKKCNWEGGILRIWKKWCLAIGWDLNPLPPALLCRCSTNWATTKKTHQNSDMCANAGRIYILARFYHIMEKWSIIQVHVHVCMYMYNLQYSTRTMYMYLCCAVISHLLPLSHNIPI